MRMWLFRHMKGYQNFEDRKGKGMFPIFEQEIVATYGMIISFGLSLGIRVFLGMLYGRIIQETDNMATTSNQLLKQCKLKFTHCYQLNNGVSNVPVFVEKFLSRLFLGPFSFGLLYHISGQLLILSMIFSGMGACRGIIAGCMFGEILPFYICSLIELYFYFLLTTVVDIRQKKETLKINLIDYLENHLSKRIQVTREDMYMLYGEEPKRTKPSNQKILEFQPIHGRKGERVNREVSDTIFAENAERLKLSGALDEEEAEALEELLKEFLSLS